MTANENELRELSCKKAKEIAQELRDNGREDPLPEIPAALLSSDHIEEYVLKTGAISPFIVGGGERNRLKKATYEARVGEKAYKYDDNGCLVELCTNPLLVKANSIVFVECDLEFRLPDFLALRFNLQIRHVHRGLLLGTGPLIDPGFWGKLCIPLHNLTDEDYTIPKPEGLIWIEFTKLSGISRHGRYALDQDRGNGHWDIRKLIVKASSPINVLGKHVAIRSSIPGIAENAKQRAERAEKSAKAAENWIKGIGIGGIGAIIVAVAGLSYAVYSNFQTAHSNIQSANRATQSAYQLIMPEIESLKERILVIQNQQQNIQFQLEDLNQNKTSGAELLNKESVE